MNSGITAEQRQKILNALDAQPNLAVTLFAVVEAASSGHLTDKSMAALASAVATLPTAPTQSGGQIENIEGHQAVVSTLTVNGKRLATLLSEGSFDKTRDNQHAYAQELGYRIATREENFAYVESLLAKKMAGDTINPAGKSALATYSNRLVRDQRGGLYIEEDRIRASDFFWPTAAFISYGALFVRKSKESQ